MGAVALGSGCGHRWWVEELDGSPLDRERDPTVDDPAEVFVVGQAFLEFAEASDADEAADRPAPMHIGEFVVGAVPLWMLRTHAATARVSADVILRGDAARMEGAQREQFSAEGVDFSFQTKDCGSSVHVRYDISHIC